MASRPKPEEPPVIITTLSVIWFFIVKYASTGVCVRVAHRVFGVGDGEEMVPYPVVSDRFVGSLEEE